MSSEAVDFSEGDSLTVDLNDVEDSSQEAIPKGKYPCVVEECEFTYSQNSGNPMWSMRLEISEGEYAGRKLFCYFVWAGKGLPITKQNISRIAPELLEGPFSPNDPDVISSMLGKQLEARVTVRKVEEGQNPNNVAGLYAAAGDGFV